MNEINKSICTHNYEDFNRTENGREMIETYLDRWGKLGFIEGLDDELKERCAVAMEQLAVYLLGESEESKSNLTGVFETIGFPMIRKIYCGSIRNDVKLNDLDLFNFEKFIKCCKELDVVKLINDINSIPHLYQIDAEAEACALGCEMIIKRFNGDERSFNQMKTESINKLKAQIKKKDEGISGDSTDA